jgi:hypothetical protein
MTFFQRIQSCFNIDLRALAVFRIAISICIIIDLISRFSYIDLFQTENGFLPKEINLGLLKYLPHYWNDTYLFQVLLIGIALIFALILLFGWYTRVATFVTWILLVSLHSKLGISTDGSDDFLRALMFWSIFLPLGAFWSVDSKKSNEEVTNYFSLAGVALILLFVFYYFSAGVSKLNNVWLGGTALEIVLRQELWLRPAGEYLSQYPSLLKILTRTVVFFELLVPFVLLIPQRFYKVRLVTSFCFFIFQIALGICLELNLMPWIATAALLMFLPSVIFNKYSDNTELFIDREPLKNAIVIPLVIYVFGGFFIHKADVKLPLYSKAYSLGLMSTWNFYDNPPQEDYDFTITAKLKNGKTINILSSLNESTNWKNPVMNSLWQNYRFKYYLELTSYQNSEYGAHFLEWIIKKWEEQYPNSQIDSASFNCFTKNIQTEEQSENKFVIATHLTSKK